MDHFEKKEGKANRKKRERERKENRTNETKKGKLYRPAILSPLIPSSGKFELSTEGT